jgi:hypothetical protein
VLPPTTEHPATLMVNIPGLFKMLVDIQQTSRSYISRPGNLSFSFILEYRYI